MGAVLAAALGQIGLPGGGYGYALGAIGYYGRRYNAVPMPTLPQGRTASPTSSPSRASRTCCSIPAAPIDTTARRGPIPTSGWSIGPAAIPSTIIRISTGCGAPLRRSTRWSCMNSRWTATARHADIVLPCTMTLEREDIGANANDPLLVAMHQIAQPYGEARDDYAIFSDLAERLAPREAFTEGRTVRQWLEISMSRHGRRWRSSDLPAPSFDEFWAGDGLILPQAARRWRTASPFPRRSGGQPLPTPSGKIEIFSETIAGFGEADCPGHPTWLAPAEVPAPSAPLILVANQPATRLHSQLDFGGHSAASKHRGREVARMHPDDAAARGIADGDIIRLFNARGACLAGVRVTDDIRPRRHPASYRRLVRSCRPGGGQPALRPRQPERADARRRHLHPGAGLHRATDDRRGRAFNGNLPPIQAYDPPVVSRSSEDNRSAK